MLLEWGSKKQSIAIWRVAYLLGGDGLLARLAELLLNLGVVSQILLATDEDDGQTLAEVKNFRDPLLIGESTCQSAYLGNRDWR